MSFEKWFGLAGKRAVVTGASRGLGRSMALALATAGADIVVTGRTQESLDETAAEIKALGRQVWTVKADMGIPEECESAFRDQILPLGPVDILINNVGNREINVPIQSETLDDWRRMIDLNLTSCFPVSYTHLTLPTTPYV